VHLVHTEDKKRSLQKNKRIVSVKPWLNKVKYNNVGTYNMLKETATWPAAMPENDFNIEHC